jgi:hypothetical protein
MVVAAMVLRASRREVAVAKAFVKANFLLTHFANEK